ncbi:response regulator [Chamaesiphon sp. VAR_48_metabat_135_sub]|uniref:response regulator transcription factor n=1 Tax=Chamaesiphon sp. VAR_48_metabat_135_sub TaxID=2964699 RepID=UPI00286D1CBA|nr:response regulator [Chamaesiphon sp. VAR_48_metabat_135_sub]
MSQILIVEDSKLEADKLRKCLENQGFSITIVTSGEEAEIRLKTFKPSLIVLDVILPGESGFELCRKLKTEVSTQNIPIVIYSTKNKQIDRTWGDMSGADAYLSKTVDETTLLETVNRLMS